MEHELSSGAIDFEAMTNAVHESVSSSTNTASRAALREYIESFADGGLIYSQDLHTYLGEAILDMNRFGISREELTRAMSDLVWKFLTSKKEEDTPVEDSSDLDEFLRSINIKSDEQR